jgi:hypothetical protein
MFEEVKASALISDWLEDRGWDLKRGVYGIETAFEARFCVKEGGRAACFNAEYGMFCSWFWDWDWVVVGSGVLVFGRIREGYGQNMVGIANDKSRCSPRNWSRMWA